jgi:hypothetical protein
MTEPPRLDLRLAEAASLLQQAETIMHRLWQDESDRGQLAPDILDLLQQTANEIEQAAGTLAQVTYQPDADEPGDEFFAKAHTMNRSLLLGPRFRLAIWHPLYARIWQFRIWLSETTGGRFGCSTEVRLRALRKPPR